MVILQHMLDSIRVIEHYRRNRPKLQPDDVAVVLPQVHQERQAVALQLRQAAGQEMALRARDG